MSPTAIDSVEREARGGDERALGKIFDWHHQGLYRYCLVIVGDPQDAEDALQDTMVKVLRALPGERREIPLKPWLYRIAHNESIDLLRRRRQSVSIEENEPTKGQGLAEQVETRQALRQLIADVGALPERQRLTLLMREAAGLDFKEIAAALGTTAAVARQTLYEARLGLREMKAGRDLECTAVMKALSDGDRRTRRRRDIRAHLRGCEQCRSFADEIDSRHAALAAISPLPAVAAARMLQSLAGGGGGVGSAGGGSLSGVAGAGAAKSIGAATLTKGAATLAVAAAIGVGGADLGGALHGGGEAAPASHQRGSVTARPDPGIDRPAPARSPAATSAPMPVPTSRARGVSKVAVADRRPASSARPAARPPDRTSTALPASALPAPLGAGRSAPRTPDASSIEHPSGLDHQKLRPASTAPGQEMAASTKAKAKTESGSGGASAAKTTAHRVVPAEHSEHPVHPTKPAAAEAGPSRVGVERKPSAEAIESSPAGPRQAPGQMNEKKTGSGTA